MKVIEKTKGSFPRRNFWSAKDKETTKAADSSPNDLVVALKGCVQNTLGACMELYRVIVLEALAQAKTSASKTITRYI